MRHLTEKRLITHEKKDAHEQRAQAVSTVLF